MPAAEQRNHARAYLAKAEEYLASAEDDLLDQRPTAAVGAAIHAGISAKDAIVTELTGATRKAKDHAAAAKELRTALGRRAEAPAAEKAMRELTGAKAEVEYGTTLLNATTAGPLLRRARFLVELAVPDRPPGRLTPSVGDQYRRCGACTRTAFAYLFQCA